MLCSFCNLILSRARASRCWPKGELLLGLARHAVAFLARAEVYPLYPDRCAFGAMALNVQSDLGSDESGVLLPLKRVKLEMDCMVMCFALTD